MAILILGMNIFWYKKLIINAEKMYIVQSKSQIVHVLNTMQIVDLTIYIVAVQFVIYTSTIPFSVWICTPRKKTFFYFAIQKNIKERTVILFYEIRQKISFFANPKTYQMLAVSTYQLQ